MSDYIHKKAIRLPITEPLMWKIGLNNIESLDIEDFIEQFDQLVSERCPVLCYAGGKTPYFDIVITDERPYIDLVLYYSYNEECGNWATAKYLSEKEKKFFTPYFRDALNISFNPNDLRKVDYCWYNCSEPPDCYNVNEEDDWTTLIGIEGY